jgi:hypothetical protein
MKMNMIRFVCSVFVLLLCSMLPGKVSARAANDDPSVTAQLTSTKPIVAKIKKDAGVMESYARPSGPSWQTHAKALEGIKTDVNKLQESMRGLQAHRSAASPRQQEAIDRITGLANELATNMNATLEHMNKSKNRPTASPYPEYLKANTRIANDLTDEIDDTIDFAQAKTEYDNLSKKLD